MGSRPGQQRHRRGLRLRIRGRNDTKAIAMAVLDHALTLEDTGPTSDAEFVLLHGDFRLEMDGLHLPFETAPLCHIPIQAGRPAQPKKGAEPMT